jgi:nucleoside-diphosphate-sugar epimerase
MRALITGDRGFLGRHFSAELKARGYEVYGLDVKASSAQDCRAYFRQDIVHRSAGGDSPGFDLVVHCAAVVGGRETIENDPLKTAESLSIDAEMFRWAAVARPGRVLYLSSSAAYPVQLQSSEHHRYLTEADMDIQELRAGDPFAMIGLPDEVYGWSKVTGELLAGRLRRTGVPVTVVRPFSGYGEDQDDTYPFRAIVERARRREDPLTVWCGDCTRDWIHVDDVVRGALAVADELSVDSEYPVNLCTGRATPFWDLARLAAEAAGYAPEIHAVPGKPQGVMYRVGDPSRMLRFYDPQISLEEGLARALGS